MSTQYIPIDIDRVDTLAWSLYYMIEQNVFVNEYGIVVFNIFDYISPNDLYLFLVHRETTIIERSHSGLTVELHYPELYFDY